MKTSSIGLSLILLLVFTSVSSGAEIVLDEAAPLSEVGHLPESLTERTGGGDLFGGRTGYVHPFLSVSEYYTDNLFNVPDGEEEEFITVISPGIWVSFPAGDRQPLRVTTLNSAPGGLAVTRFPVEARRRIQGYALYRADINEHDNFPEEDNVYQRAEGLLKVNFRGGLSLELLDIFEVQQDPYSTGVSRELDEFTSNLVQFLSEYRISPKTRVRADLYHYSLDYDEDRNAFREREDLGLSLYLFYRMLPKTSVLLQYETIEIDYEDETLSDSREHRLLSGFLWEVTGKSQATLKAGYGTRDPDEGDDRDDFIAEIRLDHRFTPKTSVYLQFSRRIEETDIRTTQDVLSHRLQAGYHQRLTARLNASINFTYYRDSYRGDITVAGQTDEREDDYYGGRLALGYLFRPWLNFGLGYTYNERDSNFENFDYTNNTIYLTITAAL